jgi:hypothetical protein
MRDTPKKSDLISNDTITKNHIPLIFVGMKCSSIPQQHQDAEQGYRDENAQDNAEAAPEDDCVFGICGEYFVRFVVIQFDRWRIIFHANILTACA